ncbi:Uncharacterized conserved protein YecE, DUF72 family [Izhakiella capsodis]|uniref:Uncharacterized conserved protein YecE, DUF72 family n=1 Tax=Izhakiella capsodis TaxID=1367852 RepID=A0A1I4UWB5_9GAMM|nr:DUF72 domain-containing protein [Izhakiella capsodis]SFM93262.1 Uncharacterized conserved protein YecE, DUF72 family [Izhakiella capsodis]
MTRPRIGLPQWQHPQWKRLGMETLADYARYFNCVEGNTTLYALPRAEIVRRWHDMTDDEFRFCFKFPAAISHQAALRNCQKLLTAFFTLMAPLEGRIGQYWLQMPAAFSPADLPTLWDFLLLLPTGFSYGIEVRHPEFFAKGDAERQLNQGLHQRGVNRVILDTRAIHSAIPANPAIIEAQRKKPRLPVHALMTADQPIIRFIGGDDPLANLDGFAAWLKKLPDWSQQGTPWLFIHTPDIASAPALVQHLWPHLQRVLPALGPMPDWPHQVSLF